MTASVKVSLYNIVVIEKTVSEFRNASAGELLMGREGKHRIGAKTYPTEAGSAGGVSCWPRGARCPLRVSVLIRCRQVGHSAPAEARVGEGISYWPVYRFHPTSYVLCSWTPGAGSWVTRKDWHRSTGWIDSTTWLLPGARFSPPHILEFMYLEKGLKGDGCCLASKSCPTLCDPMDCSPPCCSVYGDSPGMNTEVGWYFLLQGIFPSQGWNAHLLHWQEDSLPSEPSGRPLKEMIQVKWGPTGRALIQQDYCP